jgi:DUF1680 family protein
VLQLQSAFGIIALCAIAWAISEHPRAVSIRQVISSLIATLVTAIIFIKVPHVASAFGGINDAFATLAALRPGKTDYVATAKRFINTAVYKPVVGNEDILDGRHANQHIPQFIGYLRMYEQSDEADFHTAASNFWDMVVPHRVYSHGGVGVGEILRAALAHHDRHDEFNRSGKSQSTPGFL